MSDTQIRTRVSPRRRSPTVGVAAATAGAAAARIVARGIGAGPEVAR